MKLILFGATGLVGGAILKRALEEPAITSVIAVTRRILPEELTKNSKLENVVIKDFLEYSDDVTARFSGAQVCIWFAPLLQS